MSAIYMDWECKHCGHKFKHYISFGHPDEDFDYDWQCEKCGRVNTLYVPAIFPKDVEGQKGKSRPKRGPFVQVVNIAKKKRWWRRR